jgi:nucleotide-binding universal stress UspA family protein
MRQAALPSKEGVIAPMYAHLLLTTDGSPASEKAVNHAIALARCLNAKVTVLTVTEPYESFVRSADCSLYTAAEYREQVVLRMDRHLAGVKCKFEEHGVSCEALQIEHQRPDEAIVRAADDRGCDLIVMASHGRGGAPAKLLGSITINVLGHATKPVLVCRAC